MSRPFFSITTPTRNSEKTIARTIESVLNQDFHNYEYIIVDGCSSDQTIDIVKKYEPLFQGRLKWISEPDNGIYDAFNKGIILSNGVYCWNVNSDDYIEQNILSRIYDFHKNTIKDGFPIISGMLNFRDKISGDVIEIIGSNYSTMRRCFKKDYMGSPHPATLVPKEIYSRYGLYDTNYSIIGDLDWFHRVYSNGESFTFIPEVLINMMDGGTSNLFDFRKSLRDRVYFLNKYYRNPFDRYLRLLRWAMCFNIWRLAHYGKCSFKNI